MCDIPGGSAERSASHPLQEKSAPSFSAYRQTRVLAARRSRTVCPQSGVTPNPSLHNLTAPKAARSRNQLFEAPNKLSPYMTWLHESLFRISLPLHVGFISFSKSLFICSNIYTSFPHVPAPNLLPPPNLSIALHYHALDNPLDNTITVLIGAF